MDYFKMPENLSSEGQQAHAVIMEVLKSADRMNTGGCRTFYSPSEWRERDEDFGLSSELIICYDGGDVGQFFSLDKDYPRYTYHTMMTEALARVGLYPEECTAWYSAVYKK